MQIIQTTLNITTEVKNMLSFPMTAGLFTTIVSSTVFVLYLSDVMHLKERQNCTQKGTGILSVGKPLMHPRGKETRKVRFMACDNKEYDVWVDVEFVDSKYFLCKIGEQVPICYDPDDPTLVIVGDDPTLNDKLPKAQRVCKYSAAVAVVALCVLLATIIH